MTGRRGGPRWAPGLPEAARLQHPQPAARPERGPRRDRSPQARAPMNLAGAAFTNARAPGRTLLAFNFREPHPPRAPKNKARRRPGPWPPRARSGVGRSGRHCPHAPHRTSLPRGGISARPPAGGPGAGTRGPVPFAESDPPDAPSPERPDTEMPPGPPRPPSHPQQQWRAGPQRPGRQPRGREQVREGAAAASRPAPPRRAPSPRAAPAPPVLPVRPAPALTSTGAAAAFPPLLSKTRPEKPPGPEAPAREIAFRRLRGRAGAP